MGKISNILKRRLFAQFDQRLNELSQSQEQLRVLTGQALAELHQSKPPDTALSEVGFKVFSQWDEDGIIQFILRYVPIESKYFAEIGSENYQESNTRFLLIKDNWQGMLVDSNPNNIETIKTQTYYWRHHLTPVCAHVKKENINSILSQARVPKDLGLLSIDLDGNDYWIWQAIDCIRPRIVVCESNSLFGTAKVSVPYDPHFGRFKAHHSGLYWGCSLAALEYLGQQKGYSLIGTGMHGINAFFVRQDLAGALPKRSAESLFCTANVRESRNLKGEFTFTSLHDSEHPELKSLSMLPLIDVTTGNNLRVKDLRT